MQFSIRKPKFSRLESTIMSDIQKQNEILPIRVVAEIDDANRQLARLGMGDAAVGEGAGLEKIKRLAAMHGQQPGMPQQG